MKILLAGYKDPNHSSAGGYHPISQFPGADYYNGTYIPHHSNRTIVQKIWLRLSLKYFYFRVRLKRHKYDIIHCFYGDSAVYPFYKSNKHKLVITTHLDIRERKRSPKKFLKLLQNANGVIVLSSLQARELKRNFGINAIFIPHGFNTPTFEFKLPSISIPFIDDPSTINIFVSGKQYRDFETLINIVEFCETNLKHIHFHLLGQPQNVKNQASKLNNVTIYNHIIDDEYFSLLSKCDYNFMPVTFSTANNTLLEGQFLGITGIFPQLPGIEDYADSKNNLFYKTTNDLKELIANLIKRPVNEELIEFSQRFKWDNIYKILEKYYQSL